MNPQSALAVATTPAVREQPPVPGPSVAPETRRRLLFLITQFDTGGAQAQVLLRMAHLDPARYDVTLCLLTSRAGYLLDRVRARGIRVIHAGLDQQPTVYRKLARMREVLEAEQPDVVTGILGWDHTYGLLAAAVSGVPLTIAELHNEWSAIRRAPRGFRLAEAAVLGLCADAIVGCSRTVRDSHLRAWPWIRGRAMAIPNAIDIAGIPARTFRRLPDGERPLRIGTLGRLMAQKNHALLLRAAARVVRETPGVRFVIGGDGPLRGLLERQIDELGLRDHVELIGETREPYAFLQSLDLFVLSSDWEGLPVVAMEAMACGVPVIATNVGGVAELVDETTGVLCPPGDESALAAAILALVRDHTRRLALGDGARRRAVRDCDVSSAVARWSALYDLVPPRGTSRDAAHGRDPASRPLTAAKLPAGTVTRVLVLRLCPQQRLCAIVAQLRRAYPGATFDVLCQSEWEERTLRDLPGTRALVYGSGPFSLFVAGSSLLRRLRASRYDLVVVPYNLASEAGYRQAELAALWIGRGRFLPFAAWTDSVAPLAVRTWRRLFRIIAARHLDGLFALGLIARGLWKGLRRRISRRIDIPSEVAA
ncbi:MAG TPA: glycosyltransferase [Vicinamibacterales bacterium]